MYIVYREIYKDNKTMPEETLIHNTIYKTLEDATRAAIKDADGSCLRYGYETTKDPMTMIQYITKKEKTHTYRHEWLVKEMKMEEGQ